MPRKSSSQSPEEAAQRAFARAETAFQLAQQNRTQVKLAGEHDVEQARKRAAKRLEKATREVERRAEDLARADQALRSVQSLSNSAPPRPMTPVVTPHDD